MAVQGLQAQLRCLGGRRTSGLKEGPGRAPVRTSPRRVRGAEGAPELCFLGEEGTGAGRGLESRAREQEGGARSPGQARGLLLGTQAVLSSTSGLRQLTPVAPLPVGTMTNVSDKPPLRTTALHTPLHSAVEDRGQGAHPGGVVIVHTGPGTAPSWQWPCDRGMIGW